MPGTATAKATLGFRHDDPLNTVVKCSESRSRYYVETPTSVPSGGMTTSITRNAGAGSVKVGVATIEWKQYSSPVITSGGRTVPFNTFLAPAGFLSSSRIFVSSSGNQYKWKCDPLELYNSQKQLVARYRNDGYGHLPRGHDAILEIFIADELVILDEMFLSCLIMRHMQKEAEKGRRMDTR